MSKEQTKNLLKFLQPFSDNNKDMALWLREFVWDLYPNCNELIYNNYNALAIGWSPTDRLGHTFCSIAVLKSMFILAFIMDHKLLTLTRPYWATRTNTVT